MSLIGVLTGFAGPIDPMPVLFRASRLEGVLVGSVHTFETMNRAFEAKKLRPVIDDVFTLDRASVALAKMKAATHFGKIVVRVNG
ncbi:zinc-binding dehydrogenase [Polyangium jinanense]|uniref:Zinc-binding dehydrogenase n=1 Tax=Polyangium jinanense TaxID=2829994 RepID=A0A9X3X135_9BACT|nr:zinc-binding dehydrogenase [Polyangium jinanense]MDC3955528.1 zinc-binding dehydrogenase [Polyangium jinanense]MDC3982164.1 zinc-binding dehydrogenase [Polyangium jinanense]